jgi:hypothetical protein
MFHDHCTSKLLLSHVAQEKPLVSSKVRSIGIEKMWDGKPHSDTLTDMEGIESTLSIIQVDVLVHAALAQFVVPAVRCKDVATCLSGCFPKQDAGNTARGSKLLDLL